MNIEANNPPSETKNEETMSNQEVFAYSILHLNHSLTLYWFIGACVLVAHLHLTHSYEPGSYHFVTTAWIVLGLLRLLVYITNKLFGDKRTNQKISELSDQVASIASAVVFVISEIIRLFEDDDVRNIDDAETMYVGIFRTWSYILLIVVLLFVAYVMGLRYYRREYQKHLDA